MRPLLLACSPVVKGGCVGVGRKRVAIDVSHLSPLYCHPHSCLQGLPCRELHPAAIEISMVLGQYLNSYRMHKHILQSISTRSIRSLGWNQAMAGQASKHAHRRQAGGKAGRQTDSNWAAETHTDSNQPDRHTDKQTDRQAGSWNWKLFLNLQCLRAYRQATISKPYLARMVKPPHRSPLGPVLLMASTCPMPSFILSADSASVPTGCENLQYQEHKCTPALQQALSQAIKRKFLLLCSMQAPTAWHGMAWHGMA